MKKMIISMAFAAMAAVPAGAQQKSGLPAQNWDKTVRPQDDFYQYACGGWMKNNPLPAAYSRFGSFDQLGLDNNKRINGILTELEKGKYAQGSLEQKIRDLYKLSMDMTSRNHEGVNPVKPYLAEIECAGSKDALRKIQQKYAFMGLGLPYQAGFGADEKDSKNNIMNVYQGGLTLGQKEYYLDNDEATTKIRNAYKEYIVKMFQMFGFSWGEASRKMERIMRIETELAIASRSKTDLRDVEKNYNKMSLQEFEAQFPDLGFTQQENAEGIKTEYLQQLIVGQPEFLSAADKVVAGECAEDLKALMEWDLIGGSAPYLSEDVAKVRFDFFGKVLSGRKQDYETWKKATSIVESVLGQALGKMYCERYFPESSKQRMKTLVSNLQTALGERIEAQEWMSPETKKAALEKLSTFYVKIGYPDKWKDMSLLSIDPEKSLYENMRGAWLFRNNQEIAEKAGKPVDRDEWFMTPQTVNAYYNPTTNEICFPAGILQKPFFDPQADDAFNYGAIGVVIGHEMTHGFDDQGSHYDKVGNMCDWWSPADVENFKQRTGKYADFFSQIKVLPDLNANGKMTLGENLADHGGLMVAFTAYRNATKDKHLKTIDGHTPDQRFFLAYAGVWANNITEAEIRNRVKMDPHSLGRWRVNGALPHIKAWYEAFGVQPSDKMFVPENERLMLW